MSNMGSWMSGLPLTAVFASYVMIFSIPLNILGVLSSLPNSPMLTENLTPCPLLPATIYFAKLISFDPALKRTQRHSRSVPIPGNIPFIDAKRPGAISSINSLTSSRNDSMTSATLSRTFSNHLKNFLRKLTMFLTKLNAPPTPYEMLLRKFT